MAKRERQNELKIYLSDDEQFILDVILSRCLGDVYKSQPYELTGLANPRIRPLCHLSNDL